MRCWIVVAVAALAMGCGDDAGPGPGDAGVDDTGVSMDTGAGDAGGNGDAGSGGINGRLTVHTTQTANPPAGESVNFSSVMVFVGDGSQFIADTDENGSVTFEDPTLVGPQDVTVVTVRTRSNAVDVTTVVGVDVPVLVLGTVINLGAPPGSSTLTGTVTGAVPGNTVTIVLYGDEIFGQAQAASDGSFSIDVRGTVGTTAHVFAYESDATSDAVVQAGIVRDVLFDSDTVMQDVVLDHPVDTTLTVELQGDEPYAGGMLSGTLGFSLDFRPLFTTIGVPSGSTVVNPTMALTPPFDDVTREASVALGDLNTLPNGRVIARVVAEPTDDTVTLPLPDPAHIVSPAIGPEETPPSTPVAGLSLQWTADPNAVYVIGRLRQQTSTTTDFEWNFFAPAADGSFTPFTLPDGVAPITELPAGTYSVQLVSQWDTRITRLTDAFDGSVVNVTPPVGVSNWLTDVRGAALLE